MTDRELKLIIDNLVLQYKIQQDTMNKVIEVLDRLVKHQTTIEDFIKRDYIPALTKEIKKLKERQAVFERRVARSIDVSPSGLEELGMKWSGTI